VEHPLGLGGRESNPLCAPFWGGAPVRSLAVVGNGPIDEAQRQEINTFDLVVRCCCCTLSVFTFDCSPDYGCCHAHMTAAK
jgi:hypothetical protein